MNSEQQYRNPDIEAGKINLSDKVSPINMVEVLLKNPGAWFEQVTIGKIYRSIVILAFISITCYLGYSFIVGSYSGHAQWLGAPAKIISGTLLSILLCYPSLYIFACLSGANINPGKTMALFASGMTISAILLIGFAPVSFVFTFAIQSPFFMGAVHLIAWGISMYFGITHINNGLRQMSCNNTKLIKAWGTILIITMLQMTVTLRPILGESEHFLNSEKLFFIEHWMNNIDSGLKQELPSTRVNVRD